jgi:predicted nucleotidyltransferase
VGVTTTKDVARELGLSPQRVRQYADEARIPYRRTPGGHRRYEMGAVRAALARLERTRAGASLPRLLESAKAAIRELEPGARVFLFGSRARRDARPDSDWDLAIIVDGPLPPLRRKVIWDRLYEVELEDESFPVITAVLFERADWERRQGRPGLAANVAREGIEL